MNAYLAKKALAYPRLYQTAPEELRQGVAELVTAARAARSGVWAGDVTLAGARVRHEADLASVAMWPKLYRRLLAFLREGRTDLRELTAWMRAKPGDRDDEVIVAATGLKKRFHEIIATTSQRVRMLVDPVEVVVR